MALQLAAITNSIAALTVSGVTIKDIDEIPAAVVIRDNALLIPNVYGFITNFDAQKATLGEGVNSQWDVRYRLNYTLFYAPLGSARGMEHFGDAVSAALRVMDAVMIAVPVTGCVLLRPAGVSDAGPVADAGGNQFFGLQLSLDVLEFVG
jgi:hypothetical protein